MLMYSDEFGFSKNVQFQEVKEVKEAVDLIKNYVEEDDYGTAYLAEAELYREVLKSISIRDSLDLYSDMASAALEAAKAINPNGNKSNKKKAILNGGDKN